MTLHIGPRFISHKVFADMAVKHVAKINVVFTSVWFLTERE